MAEVLVDDLDQTVHTDKTPVTKWHFAFGPEGKMTTYAIDLTESNYNRLVAALQPFLDRAEPADVPNSPKRRSASSKDTAAIRAWAVKKGLQVSDRGRISRDVQEAYRKAKRK